MTGHELEGRHIDGRQQDVQAAQFFQGDYVVYRGHGVGRVKAIDTESVAGQTLKVILVVFNRDGMVLRVPFQKVRTAGLRPVVSPSTMREALLHLLTPAAVASGFWNRRMVEYTAKVNSGNLLSVTEVVRDLHRVAPGKSRSPSAQMIYERAYVHLSDELAAVEQTNATAAAAKLDSLLNAA